jgi:CRISPR system Cascade subunit CasD
VILSSRTDNPPYSLEMIGNSLKTPSFSMYLGRKSCPLSLPLDPMIVSGTNMKEALANAEFKDEDFVRNIIKDGVCRFYWDDPDEDISFEHSISRRDKVLSRKRWQFSDRKEYYSMIDWGNDACI